MIEDIANQYFEQIDLKNKNPIVSEILKRERV
jgi:hypothetical protein